MEWKPDIHKGSHYIIVKRDWLWKPDIHKGSHYMSSGDT